MRGFSLLEILMALALLSSTLVAITFTTIGIPSMLGNAELEHGAYVLADGILTKERHLAMDRFDLVSSAASTTAGIYTASLSVLILPDEYTKKITSHVAWRNNYGRIETVVVNGLVTDFAHASDGTCSPTLSGDWTHPVAKSYALSRDSLLGSQSAVATTSVSALASSDSILSIGAGTTAQPGDPDLFFFTIHNDSDPELISSFGTSMTTAGIAALTVSKKILYIANASACTSGNMCGPLQILDIADPLHPRFLSRVMLSNTTPVPAKSIAYRNGIIYLGLTKTPNTLGDTNKDPEFVAINVHDPANPQVIGSYAVGRTVNAITLRGDYAYLATDDRTHADILILDIRDPSAIAKVAAYAAPPSSNASFGFAHSIAVSEKNLYVGRTLIGNGDEFLVLSDPPSFALVSAKNLGTSVEGILLRSSLAFLLAARELEIWDMDDPAHPASYAPPVPLPQGTTATTFICNKNTLYIGSVRENGVGSLTKVTAS